MEQLLVTVKVLELKDLEPIYLLDESILLYEINYDKYQVDLSISRVRRDVYNNVRNLMWITRYLLIFLLSNKVSEPPKLIF